KSIYIATIKVKSFTAKMSIVEALHCYNDSTGKIRTVVSNEKNGPIGTPDTYTFSWLPAASFIGTNPVMATGANASSVKGGMKAGTYTCVVTNGNCSEAAMITLINPLPLHTDSIYAYYCPKDSLALLIADTGNTNYIWHPNNSVASVTGDSAHVIVQDINQYYVTYLRNGCADTGKIIISVTTYDAFRPDELVNVFSPNGDKSNDFFYPFYSATINQYQIFKQSDTYELNVYDRWGKLVYSATDYNKPWDGKTKSGHEADNGTYFFVVKYKSNCGSKADVVEKKGFVELVR
ncbi:MAG TPA: gliding motility-associated C-terminal domain-containing protein, partial [Bacteroidia bacterium]|nr:gliding motility-associated C-terminal domain-containing protein [Bacteroidia bacterium]